MLHSYIKITAPFMILRFAHHARVALCFAFVSVAESGEVQEEEQQPQEAQEEQPQRPQEPLTGVRVGAPHREGA